MTSDSATTPMDEPPAAAAARADTSPPGQAPGYDLSHRLGDGAFGEVWVALDRLTRRQVAIKFYTRGSGADCLRLAREVEKLAVLSADRYVVQLLTVGWEATPPYYVMDFIENGSLEARLAAEGPMPVGEAVEMFREIAEGVAHAHAKGVLHCDLKPANVLLDEDHKPRLADFGQARLTSEQAPAMGTLFYMAPEQADVKSSPDVRWDIYALGCILHCMLTGAPPHRSPESLEEIQSAADLPDMLARYRQVIRKSPLSTAHRRVRGVDRALADLIDQMLAPNPEDRLASVEGALKALTDRQAAKARRPLVVLGLVGPLALLLMTGLFAYRGFEQAIDRSTESVVQKSHETNRWAAQVAAGLAAREIERTFDIVESVASQSPLQSIVQATVDHPEFAALAAQLRDPRLNDIELPAREQLVAHPLRVELQDNLESLLARRRAPAAYAWFVTNAEGTMLAATFAGPVVRSPIGRNFSYRAYYHGGSADFRAERDEFPPFGQRVAHTQLSPAFPSTSTEEWIVTVSTPLSRGGRSDGEFLGVLGLAMRVGNLMTFESTPTQFAVLVDDRQGNHRGAILQHPLYDEILRRSDRLPGEFARSRVDVASLNAQLLYRDPLGQTPEGKDYARPWIAAAAPVRLGRVESSEAGRGRGGVESGLLALVQEDYGAVVEPVRRLEQRLILEGVLAGVAMLLIVAALWMLASRAGREPRHAPPRRRLAPSTPTPLESIETLPASDRARQG